MCSDAVLDNEDSDTSGITHDESEAWRVNPTKRKGGISVPLRDRAGVSSTRRVGTPEKEL